MSKPFQPTDEQRENVEEMIGYGIPQAEICRLIKNPATGNPIDEKTLRLHFAAEIDTGQTKANAKVGQFIHGSIVGTTGVGVTNEIARANLAMFWATRRMGWKETNVHEHKGRIEISDVRERIAGRITRLAAAGTVDEDPC